MSSIQGDQDLPQTPSDLWPKLTDPNFLVRCVPGIEKLAQLEPNRAVFILRPGLAFMRGTLEVTMEIGEAVPNQSARFILLSKGIGSTSDVQATITFQPHESGSRVHWTAEIRQLGGLLKAVPGGLIQAAARKVISDAWTAVESQLRQEPAPPPAS